MKLKYFYKYNYITHKLKLLSIGKDKNIYNYNEKQNNKLITKNHNNESRKRIISKRPKTYSKENLKYFCNSLFPIRTNENEIKYYKPSSNNLIYGKTEPRIRKEYNSYKVKKNKSSTNINYLNFIGPDNYNNNNLYFI